MLLVGLLIAGGIGASVLLISREAGSLHGLTLFSSSTHELDRAARPAPRKARARTSPGRLAASIRAFGVRGDNVGSAVHGRR